METVAVVTKSNNADIKYKLLVDQILREGFLDENPRPHYKDGTPAHTYSLNQVVQNYDISKGEFPIITLRPLAVKSAIREILWIYQDQSNSLKLLKEKHNIGWWDEWESTVLPGTIGVRYGATVKKHDMMNNLLDGLKNDPFGRRHIMSLWQESDFDESDGLMPCAFLTMWNVRKQGDKYYLDMTLVQRSSDWIMAGNINQVQYVALLMMVATSCGYEPGVFTHFLQNVQVYDRHVDAAKELLARYTVSSPSMVLNKPQGTDFYEYTIDDFEFVDFPVKEIAEQNPKIDLEIAI